MFQKLRFFRGTEHDLNFTQDENGVYKGTIHIDPVSSGLYETVNLFMLEEVEKDDQIWLNYPTSNFPYGSTLEFKWLNDFDTSKDIIMYGTKLENGIINIDQKKNQSFDLIDITDNEQVETYFFVSTALDDGINFKLDFTGDGAAADGIFAPELTLKRGFTYIFDQSDLTNLQYIMAFSEVEDGETSQGVAADTYTNGVEYTGNPGSNGILTFTVPLDAPDTLYYFSPGGVIFNESLGNVINIIDADLDLNDNGYKEVEDLNNSAISVNIALMSLDEGRHHRTLQIYEKNSIFENIIAEIKFYGEVEAEDERLKVLLGNLGARLEDTDFLLFKDHDISEMAPDHILLNRKRKELLLELHDIKPFVGTYKAILNAIDFFGYNNITLKEYWMNIDDSSDRFGKLKAIPVPNSSKYGEIQRKAMSIQLPSSTLKKTSRFSLVYKINVPNGDFDYWDIPEVDEVFDFTPEEVLIKLYGLKDKLQREYLPLNAKIVDITGEGDFFAQKSMNFWNNQNTIAFFSEGHDIKFDVLPKDRNLYVEDFALVLKNIYDENDISLTDEYNTLLNVSFDGYGDLSGDIRDANGEVVTHGLISILRDQHKSFYKEYLNKPLDTFNQDIPVGCPITLDGSETFTYKWDDAEFNWNDAIDPNGSLLITWKDWWKRWVYEIEWVIKGPRGYDKAFRGLIDDFLVFPLALPYDGKYSVEMRTYDLFGHRSYEYRPEEIDVKLKDVEIYGLYKWMEEMKWMNNDYDWDSTGGVWEMPLNNSQYTSDILSTFYLSMDRANYLHDDSHSVNTSMVRRYLDIYSETGYSKTAGPYQWDNCSFRWNDGKHNWWNATEVGMDLTASFKIMELDAGTTLNIIHTDPTSKEVLIGEYTSSVTPTGPQDLAAWQQITNELNSSSDLIISKFNYNIIYVDANGDGSFNYTGEWLPVDGDGDGNVADGGGPAQDDQDDIPLQNILAANILAVGKNYSRSNDFDDVYVTNTNGINIVNAIRGKLHCEHNNPTFDNVRVFRDFAEVERSTHLTISSDITKMPGVKKHTWKINNSISSEEDDIYYDDMWLTYIFQRPGYYNIKLDVEDTNGNINSIERNMLKVK